MRIKCEKCSHEIIKHNFNKHESICDGLGPRRLRPKKGKGWAKNKTYDEIYGSVKADLIKNKIKKSNASNVNKRKLTSEEEKIRRTKISESMKTAYKEGRAFGWSHQHGKDLSYPEEFVYKILKNYGVAEKFKVVTQLNFGKYTLDFAIIDLKLNIEVDGEHHYRNKSVINKDIIRNEFLVEHGWKVYRICWKQMFHNTQTEIDMLLKFIYDTDSVNIRSYNINDILLEKKSKTNTIIEIKKNNELQRVPIIEALLESNIDFTKFGWVSKASKIIKISPPKVNKWMKRFMPDFYESSCFKKVNTKY